jgi:hypothetical protein
MASKKRKTKAGRKAATKGKSKQYRVWVGKRQPKKPPRMSYDAYAAREREQVAEIRKAVGKRTGAFHYGRSPRSEAALLVGVFIVGNRRERDTMTRRARRHGLVAWSMPSGAMPRRKRVVRKRK